MSTLNLYLWMNPNGMPIEQGIRLIANQDVTLAFQMAVPLDVTGWNVTFQVDDKLGGTAKITKTVSGGGITLSDPGRGTLQVALANTDTNTLTVPADYVWELKRTDSGNNTVLARGEIVLEQNLI